MVRFDEVKRSVLYAPTYLLVFGAAKERRKPQSKNFQMNNKLLLLVAVFIGEILLLLLGGWIYTRLVQAGVFGSNPRYRRAGAVLFIFLPVACGLALLPAVLLLAGPGPATSGLPALPILSGAGEPQGKIVYTCQVFADMERDQVCLINPDGSGWRRLTLDDGGDYSFPSLSPDGRSVFFAGRTETGYEIFEQPLQGGGPLQLTNGLADAAAPHAAPDNRSLVFARRQENGQSIWVMDRDGGNPRMVFGPPGGNGWDPVWSPDGRQILFASDRVGEVQLFRIDPDGSNLTQVSRLEGIRGRSDWSPDGALVATYAGSAWEREVYLMDPDGSNPRPITQGGNNLAPSFSPDGKWIVFTSYRDRYRDENGCEIYRMRVDGSEVTRLTDNEYCDWQPRWGP
jgi:TolB protein